ncbi:MAG: hypothetical protein ACE14M_16930, partial [Terriglobales bacterium]
ADVGVLNPSGQHESAPGVPSEAGSASPGWVSGRDESSPPCLSRGTGVPGTPGFGVLGWGATRKW